MRHWILARHHCRFITSSRPTALIVHRFVVFKLIVHIITSLALFHTHQDCCWGVTCCTLYTSMVCK
jgi:hypothetical protein